ncbi:MAG: DUF4416 family protein [Nitrospirae bacterium]|jgi:hypothetical protein|nr:DUF4416 family protein [Nitrospirota bacterium]
MGRIAPPERVMLFAGFLFNDTSILEKSLELLTKLYGDILFKSQQINWNYSEYYNNELGKNILRQFVFFKNLIDPANIVDIKIQTNKFEEMFLDNNRRRINIDPGYMSLAKIVLATTKNYSHRIYLGRGIYAEVTLIYKNNTFIPFFYTYKDYRGKEYIDIFLKARNELKNILKN